LSELLKWFEKRREKKAIAMIEKHLATTMSAVEDLEAAVEAAVKNDEEKMKMCIERVAKSEMEADGMRRRVMDQLAHGELPPIDREDLMHLVKRVDMVADWSREAARLLEVIPLESVPNSLDDPLLKMMEGIRKCAVALRKCIDRMIDKPVEALEAADEVERLEEAVDELHTQARRVLVQERDLQPSVAVLLNELLESLEMIADSCENTCDQVRIIMVRH